uniref:PGG domain-containing protein n=1 Tax=Opuntia streptacantha TaxID=393608 RepID=A0A7C8YZA0_OPUST
MAKFSLFVAIIMIILIAVIRGGSAAEEDWERSRSNRPDQESAFVFVNLAVFGAIAFGIFLERAQVGSYTLTVFVFAAAFAVCFVFVQALMRFFFSSFASTNPFLRCFNELGLLNSLFYGWICSFFQSLFYILCNHVVGPGYRAFRGS